MSADEVRDGGKGLPDSVHDLQDGAAGSGPLRAGDDVPDGAVLRDAEGLPSGSGLRSELRSGLLVAVGDRIIGFDC